MKAVDLDKWTAESYDREQIGADKYKQQEAAWAISGDGKSVTQPMDASPTFFYSDFNSFDTKISVKVGVKTPGDDDFIGFALNFKPGDTSNKNAEFLLLNWNAQPQRAGLKLSQVKGIPSFLSFLRLPEVAKANTLGTTGWKVNQTYQFEIEWRQNKLQIWVDGKLEFDIDGEFEDGRFACFDLSQRGAVFSDIEVESKEDSGTSSWDNLSQTKLQPSDLQDNDISVWSVAISGDLAIVGANGADAEGKPNAGAAYIFAKEGGTWQQKQKLQPSDLKRDDNFGYSMAISGDLAIVGADRADVGGILDTGTAYIFAKEGGTWQQKQKLQPSDLQGYLYYFGNSVAISGDLAIVGAHGANVEGRVNMGAAYIFAKEGGTWQQKQKLQPSDLQNSGYFGYSVAISGDLAIVGAYRANAADKINTGAVHIFAKEGGAWQQKQKLQPSDLQRYDNFGYSIAISGDLAIVGAYGADAEGKSDAGAAYIFALEGGTWQQKQKLQPSDLQRGDNFGYSVAISGNVATVGAYRADAADKPNAGAAYIFALEGGTWQQKQKLQPSDLKRGDNFGNSVAISGNVATVGAWGGDAEHKSIGTAYIFEASS